jgi:ABC-type sugar transport system ATPase subunit
MEIPAKVNDLKASEVVTVGIRPEHIRIGPSDGNARGRVELVEQLGESHLLYVRTRPDLILTVRAPGDARASTGEDVVLDLPAEGCHIFDRSGAAIARPHRIGAPAG